MAERASQHFEPETEWMLDSKIFQAAIQILDFEPTVDMFGSRLNRQLPNLFHGNLNQRP